MKHNILSIFISLSILFWLSSAYVKEPSTEPQCPSVDPDLAILLPDPDDCGSFYECAYGKAYKISCQAGLYYNIELQVCDYPSDVDCGTRPTTPTPDVTTASS